MIIKIKVSGEGRSPKNKRCGGSPKKNVGDVGGGGGAKKETWNEVKK